MGKEHTLGSGAGTSKGREETKLVQHGWWVSGREKQGTSAGAYYILGEKLKA